MMNETCMIFVCILLARAMYTDILSGRIENWVTVLGGMGCVGYTYMVEGWSGIWDIGKDVALVWVCLLVLYGLGGLGAGDVKLMGMAGMWIPERMWSFVVAAFFVGAFLACGRMAIRWIRRQQVYIRGETIPFAVPVACSFVACVVSGGMI